MSDLKQSIGKAPRWVLVTAATVLLALIGYGMYYLTFGVGKTGDEVPDTILLDMPDAPEDSYEASALEEFGRDRWRGGNRVSDYWDSLGDDDVSGDPPAREEEYLDPSVYSPEEIRQIRNGFKTRAQVDAERAEREARQMEYQRRMDEAADQARPRQLSPEQADSVYMSRLEKAYKMAAKYSAQPAPEPAEAGAEAPAEPKEEDRRLDLDEGGSVLPTESFAGDGIISSLDSPSGGDVVHYGGKVRARPVKATFLKNERLSSGNRVIMRLMQDMTLSDGTVIPANTHITGTCAIGRRMRIDVTMLHYGGRMFPVDISVYDNDGTEGIYCPLTEETGNMKRKAKKVTVNVMSSAGTLIGTAVTGNPILGSMASNGIRSATSSVGSDGTVSVEVSAGYEFYVYENTDDSKDKK